MLVWKFFTKTTTKFCAQDSDLPNQSVIDTVAHLGLFVHDTTVVMGKLGQQSHNGDFLKWVFKPNQNTSDIVAQTFYPRNQKDLKSVEN